MGWFSRDHEDWRRKDDVTPSEVDRRLSSFITDYREDKKEIHEKLDEHGKKSDSQHNENISRFSRIEKNMYIAMGGASVIFWILSEIFRSHGGK